MITSICTKHNNFKMPVAPPTKVFVAIIGFGGVGKAFVSQLAHYIKAQSSIRPISVVYVSRSRKALISEDYSPLPLSSSIKEDLDTSHKVPLTSEELSRFLAEAPGQAIIVDNTSSLDVAQTYPTFLKRGQHIATPNKKGFSSDLTLWEDILAQSSFGKPNKGHIYHEATVGAGLPVISTLRELLETGDEIIKIEGVFSGTMSFIFNEFAPVKSSSPSKQFSEVVKIAQQAGYTEPDPRDDLNGLDVARKLTILGRIAKLHIPNPTSFPVQSLIPKALESASSADEFLNGLSKHDHEIGQMSKEAEDNGKVIRYVGSIDVPTQKVKVGLESFDVAHPIAGLKGSDNIIAFYTKRYGSNPLIIQGAGAGADVTAMGVLGDVIKIIQRIK